MKIYKFDWFSGYGGLRCYCEANNKEEAIELFNSNTVYKWEGETKYNTITEVKQRDEDGVPMYKKLKYARTS